MQTLTSFITVVKDGQRYRWMFQRHDGHAVTSDATFGSPAQATDAANSVAACYNVPVRTMAVSA